MSSLSVVNDSSVSRSDVLQNTSPVVVSSASSLDLNANGIQSLYYICAAATTMTFPVDYGRYKGRVVHVSGNGAAVTVAQSGASSGAVFAITGGAAINAAGSATLAASGTWVSLICDGLSGWLVFATDAL
jgi:hypothetical protein